MILCFIYSVCLLSQFHISILHQTSATGREKDAGYNSHPHRVRWGTPVGLDQAIVAINAGVPNDIRKDAFIGLLTALRPVNGHTLENKTMIPGSDTTSAYFSIVPPIEVEGSALDAINSARTPVYIAVGKFLERKGLSVGTFDVAVTGHPTPE